MKRKANAAWVFQQLSKIPFENIQIIIPGAPHLPSESLRLVISIKNHPVEFTTTLANGFICSFGLPGFDVLLNSLDSFIGEKLPLKMHSTEFSSIPILDSGIVMSPVLFKTQLIADIVAYLTNNSVGIKVYMYAKQGLNVTSAGNELKASIQHRKPSGVFKLIARCSFLTDKFWDEKGFDLFVQELISFRDKESDLLSLAIKQKVFVEINAKTVNSPHEAVDVISQSVSHQVATKKKRKNLEQMFNKMVSEKAYHEMFERNEDRKITILCAPTNSGKTYQGTQIIKQALRASEDGHCQMLFPLRVLALQIQQDMEKDGVPCSMITGEEQDIREHSRLDAMTVEIFDTDKDYETVFLDEGQLSFSNDRSSGYLRVLCGAKCKHLVVACAPSAIAQLEWFLTDILKSSYEITRLERLTPLTTIDKPVSLSDVRDGDLVVAFSRRSIHEIAEKLASKGLSVGTMYGALSPSARRAMLDQYRANGYQVLVATDAIGMGISAPAQRVLFAETDKFDGTDTRELVEEEYRQIAGRAGRFGLSEFGEAGVLDGKDPSKLIEILSSEPTILAPPKRLFVTPDKNQLLAAEELGLVQGLNIWGKAIKSNPLYQVAVDSFDELLLKAEWLDEKVSSKDISYSEAVRLLYVTFPMRGRGSRLQLYKDWVTKAYNDKLIPPLVVKVKDDLKKLEDMSVDITLMIQLSRIFPLAFQQDVQLNKQQNMLGEFIAKQLEKKYCHK
jgi:hypothetical protein